MSKRILRGCLSGVLVLGFAAGVALADDRTSSPAGTQDRIAELEALLQAQQQKLDALERQVSDSQDQDMDAARVEEMKRQIREVMSQHEFRESLMPATMCAGYDKGFYIKDVDDNFHLQINGRVQLRFTHYGTRSGNRWLRPGLERNDRTGFDMPRIWVVFSGHAYTKDLTYQIALDAGNATDPAYRFRPFYAWANYRFSDEFQVRAGLMRIMSTRQQTTYDGNLQFPDRNMVDAVFGLDRGVGVQFWGKLFERRLDWYLQVVNSFNGVENRVINPDPAELDGNPGLVFRTVWHALGEGDGSDFLQTADLEFHESPALDLGMHYAYNNDEGDFRTSNLPYPQRSFLPGGFGLTNTNGLKTHQLGVDGEFKFGGFSATAEYMVRFMDVKRAWRQPFTPLWLLTGEDGNPVNHGAYLQLGYFLPIPGLDKQLEVVARTGAISAMANGTEGAWEYGAGLNYYLQGNNVKLMTDVTKIDEAPTVSPYSSMANVNDDILMWRVQLQVAF